MNNRLLVFLFSLLMAGPVFSEKKDVIVMPEYPGGAEAMKAYMEKNIVYPTDARKLEISGEVVVEFIVERGGSINGVNVIKGVSPDLDKEAIRVVKKMPRWKPGTKNGITARVKMTLPINFKVKHTSQQYIDKSENVK